MTEAGASTPEGQPRVLIYTAALGCGFFLALAVHIALTAAGLGLASAARDASFFSGKDQINVAVAWWAIGIAGCLGSLAAIAAARRLNQPGFRALRVALVFAFVCLMAVAGHEAAALPTGGAAMTVMVNLAAMALGGFMAFFAAHFAARN